MAANAKRGAVQSRLTAVHQSGGIQKIRPTAEMFFLNRFCDDLQVCHFDNGRDFLETFKAGFYCVAELDLSLLEMDGFEVLRRIRLIDQNIPAIAFSAMQARILARKLLTPASMLSAQNHLATWTRFVRFCSIPLRHLHRPKTPACAIAESCTIIPANYKIGALSCQ
jgi:CheY-like chemotaxis protein